MDHLEDFSGSMSFDVCELDAHALDELRARTTHLVIDLTDPDELIDGLRRKFGGFEYVILRVDGKEHTYKASELIDKLREIEVEA